MRDDVADVTIAYLDAVQIRSFVAQSIGAMTVRTIVENSLRPCTTNFGDVGVGVSNQVSTSGFAANEAPRCAATLRRRQTPTSAHNSPTTWRRKTIGRTANFPSQRAIIISPPQ